MVKTSSNCVFISFQLVFNLFSHSYMIFLGGTHFQTYKFKNQKIICFNYFFSVKFLFEKSREKIPKNASVAFEKH